MNAYRALASIGTRPRSPCNITGIISLMPQGTDNSFCGPFSLCCRVALAVAALLCAAPAGSPDTAPGVIVVHPEETAVPLPNPYMGHGIWAGRHGFGNNEKSYTVADDTKGFGDGAALFNWVLIDWDWASLEPREGEFAWKDFDAVVSYWRARGKQFFVRFWVTDDPGWNGRPGADVLPDWLWAKGLKGHDYTGNGGLKRREPDYAGASYASVYLPALEKLLASFARKYDRPDTPVMFLQVMGYGHWADWATWYSKYRFSSVAQKHEILSRIMHTYLRTFKYVPLLEFAGPDWDTDRYRTLDDFLYSKALDVAAAHRFGFMWTGFIDGIGGLYDRATMQRFWREHPILAEGNWNYDDMKDQHTHGTIDENMDGAIDFHANFVHFYLVPGTYQRAMRDDRAAFERALGPGGVGYRLVPASLSWSEEVPAGNLFVLRQTWVNRNAGRLYRAHPLKLYLTGEDGKEVFSEAIPGFDETHWVRGESYPVMSVFHLAKTIPPGAYDVRLALVDAAGKPAIRLGIRGEDAQWRYKVGSVRILPPALSGVCDQAFCK